MAKEINLFDQDEQALAEALKAKREARLAKVRETQAALDSLIESMATAKDDEGNPKHTKDDVIAEALKLRPDSKEATLRQAITVKATAMRKALKEEGKDETVVSFKRPERVVGISEKRLLDWFADDANVSKLTSEQCQVIADAIAPHL